MNDTNILEVKNLKMYFGSSRGVHKQVVKAVDDISFTVKKGQVFGLVGESGCGKTTAGKCILRINNPTDGQILFNNNNLATMSYSKLKPIRRQLQLIFQDPSGSLNPRQTVGAILKDAIVGDKKRRPKSQISDEISRLLQEVELLPEMADRYPHELSGGQRQRLGIARALACNPELIVCDEPVSALDVSIQAQIINLFEELKNKLGLTYVFIAHDIAVVRHIADVIAVMYLGNIVEMMDAKNIFRTPMHPYSRSLISAVPIISYDEERKRERIILQGEVPSPINVPSGCAFHPRCSYAKEICKREKPSLKDYGNEHYVACHFAFTESLSMSS